MEMTVPMKRVHATPSTLISKHLLLSDEDTAPRAAQKINTYYFDEFLASDPLLKIQDDKRMEGFLGTLYRLIFDFGPSHPLQRFEAR